MLKNPFFPDLTNDDINDGFPFLFPEDPEEPFEDLDLYYDEENDTVYQSPPQKDWDD